MVAPAWMPDTEIQFGFKSEVILESVVPAVVLARLTVCAAETEPGCALNVRLAGVATIVPVVPPPVPTLNVTVIVVAVPTLGVMVMCPVYELFTRVAALADTVRVAGLPGVTVKLPLVIWAESQLG